MKKIISSLMSVILLIGMLSFTAGANPVNEPTTEELEAVIKATKPNVFVPEECTEFTWRFNAGNAYNDASWRLTWQTKSEAEGYARVILNCDSDGNITSYNYYNDTDTYRMLPKYLRNELSATANEFIKKAVPTAYENVKLDNSYSNGFYSGVYIYEYVRYINGNPFPENYITVSINYVTGEVMSMTAQYDYKLSVSSEGDIISPERAREILGTRQSMTLKYMTKIDTDKETDERTVKAFLVYVPDVSYLAVDAVTGEIYDTKSEWQVRGGGGASNGILMDKAEAEAGMMKGEGYQLTEQEKTGLKELEGLISKDEAIKAVTENKYLYFDKNLTSVSANLLKNNSSSKTSTYQNNNGSYTWSLSFSNPVADDKYYSTAYASASVNAETGELIAFSSNLNNYYYYAENKLEIPDVKYSADEGRTIAEEFLSIYAKEKLENSVKRTDNATNMISYKDHTPEMKETVYGAHNYSYVRVNEGIAFNKNTLNIGIDLVTGKVFSFNYTWWTNVEFQSPVGAISPEKALDSLLTYDGYGLVYERNVTYIFKPITESSKKHVSAAFIASLKVTKNNNGDIDAVIKKYAKDIDKEKLVALLGKGDEKELYSFVSGYFGVSTEETKEASASYVDSSEFYDKEILARLVYTCYDMPLQYVSPFSGRQLDTSGNEYAKVDGNITYTDIEGHWIEDSAVLLADIGIGFEGGSFNPDKVITVSEFIKLSESLGIYNPAEESDTELDRIGAVRTILDSLGYGKIASLKGIYKTEFQDNDSISEDDIGYAAISFGLGILKGDGKNADLYSKLTRAQALSLLINVVSVSK